MGLNVNQQVSFYANVWNTCVNFIKLFSEFFIVGKLEKLKEFT